MIRRIIIFSLFLCQCFNTQAQFFDDFSDSDLNSNPVWEGDLEDFIVNDAEMLQLNANGEGNLSQLFTQINMPDTIQWDMELRLAFSPSANNRLRVYLALDGLEVSQASGYYIEIGENGAADALNVYYLNEGSSEILGTGQTGALGEDPAYVHLNILRFPSGEWNISTAYNENEPLAEELVFMHSEYDFGGNQIFLLECNYTASRSDKFFFDNIGIKKYERDRTGPVILSASLLDAKTIDIQANEKLDPASVDRPEDFVIENFSGSITSVELVNNDTGIRLSLSENLNSGRKYSLSISGLVDENGNAGASGVFELFVLDEAVQGDLVVNEILFNPETGGSDYVEVLNISDKFIWLGNLQIANLDRQEIKDISEDEILFPGNYICFSEDVAYLKDRYATPDSARFLEVDIPAYNNDEGNVSIINSISGELIDTYNYSEDTHFQELDDLNGVSLERVSPFDNKWFSASSAVGFGTPGYQNSVFLDPDFSAEELLSFESKTFSPNQDGMDDQLVIKYQFPDNGYQVDVTIYDQYGRLVRTLINNELLSGQGFVLWDGLEDSGEQCGIGVYFIILEGFNVLGDVISVKKPAILADFLK